MPLCRKPRIRQGQVQPSNAPRNRESGRRSRRGQYPLHESYYVRTLYLFHTHILTTWYSGYCAFTHKAGIHAKAILNNPSTYEILKPEDFGLTRYVSIGYVNRRSSPSTN